MYGCPAIRSRLAPTDCAVAPWSPRSKSTSDNRVRTGRIRMSRLLENKRALVTGGSRGTGAAIVKRLAREGAHVALTYVSNQDKANETATDG